ncbi:hypothetical protein FIBSPDRAFT_888313 [Athelia psychrophila]|uniref:Nucleoporin POM152 Ig-like domain-containing protein n=1 Tax=Athelia psychrophila TaxID=1759441 RepID=A0A166NMI6_9AGAM|nr:hypothetical protein FIBSPDRAFT_888313 [Fibularhizoctonia sp. CBS 109695]
MCLPSAFTKDLKAVEAGQLTNGKRDTIDDDQPKNLSIALVPPSLFHILLRKPGTAHLERAMTASNVPSRLTSPPNSKSQSCPARRQSSRRSIWILLRDHYLVEGTKAIMSTVSLRTWTRPTSPLCVLDDLKVPLQITLGAVGKHGYVLEEVIDSVGNVVVVDLAYSALAWKLNCKPGAPTSLPIDQEVGVTTGASDADDLDALREVSFKYQPPTDLGGDAKKFKLWKKGIRARCSTSAQGMCLLPKARPLRSNGLQQRLSKRGFTNALEIPARSPHSPHGSPPFQKVELNGPGIDQIVHPLAAPEFVNAGQGTRGKTMINSCAGNLVDVDVDLRNLGVQAVCSTGSGTLQIPGREASRAKVQVPIPREVGQEGGSFAMNLRHSVSVEDLYGCKWSIWKIKYRRSEAPSQLKSVSLSSPNAQLHVKEADLYEIVEVKDSQYPGTIILEESTYQVDWVPRPSVSLPETVAPYPSHHRSRVLPPISRPLMDHVDLDLMATPDRNYYEVKQIEDPVKLRRLEIKINPPRSFKMASSSQR